jgi:hypothetical protein
MDNKELMTTAYMAAAIVSAGGSNKFSNRFLASRDSCSWCSALFDGENCPHFLSWSRSKDKKLHFSGLSNGNS